MTINYTLLASCIAAAASLASAWISYFSKEKDFKNDYYKKVIDKRLKAYEEVEQTLFTLRLVAQVIVRQTGEMKDVLSIFLTEEAFDSMLDNFHEAVKKGVWLSEEIRIAIVNLNNKLLAIKQVARPNVEVALDVSKLIELGIENEENIDKDRKRIHSLLVKEIANMQDVNSFLKKLAKEYS